MIKQMPGPARSNSILVIHSEPTDGNQATFVQTVIAQLLERGLRPQTLALPERQNSPSLATILRLLSESCGLITIALRSTLVFMPTEFDEVQGGKELVYEEKWITSPICHVAPAMAYQRRLPQIVLRQQGLMHQGVFQKKITRFPLSEFDLRESPQAYLKSARWLRKIDKLNQAVSRSDLQERTPRRQRLR
jgi:hypothetical protein